MDSHSPAIIHLNPVDNVAVARVDLVPGQTVIPDDRLVVQDPINAGHKIALRDIACGEPLVKYGHMIGIASQAVLRGEHVHLHNVAMVSSAPGDCVSQAYRPAQKADVQALFQGYVRADGRVATRNYLGVVSSVNCSATVCREIARRLNEQFCADYPNIDGVVAIRHGTGCGMSVNGSGLALLQRTLCGYASHPNFAAVLVVGLGCEINQVTSLVQAADVREPGRLAALTIQEAGGTRAAIDTGVAKLREMLPIANRATRTPVSAAHITLGLQCGGSDAYSGISANPVLGAAVDLLVQHGGTAILSETPEIYGAEHLLTARAASVAVAERLMERLRWWEDYARSQGTDLNSNPSPGNKAGGITTILEKSLGAVAKGGSTGLMAVYEYAERVRERGLVFMDTPGYDPVSATGQVAGGANLICFTTGRGSTYGCKPVPSLKLASNSGLFQRMRGDMDFNCGPVVDGQLNIAEAGQSLFELILATASGHATCSEEQGLGDDEFVPWQLGAVM